MTKMQANVVIVRSRRIGNLLIIYKKILRLSLLLMMTMMTTMTILLPFSSFAVNAANNNYDDDDKNRYDDEEKYYNDYFSSSSLYKRYSSYPPYCSTPEEMSKRRIPPLIQQKQQENNSTTSTTTSTNNTAEQQKLLSSLELVHVTTVIRHGARTPTQNTMNCWDDYWSNPQTSIWNCNLTSYLVPPPPPPPPKIRRDANIEEEGDTTTTTTTATDYYGVNPMFLFEKRYDALLSPPIYSNILNGTCQLGQLILQGYYQELQNGQFLRQAYLQSSSSSSSSGNNYDQNNNNATNTDDSSNIMNLITIDDTTIQQDKDIFNKLIYYRVDDDERTLMSGQILLRGLLGGGEGGGVVNEYFQYYKYYPTIRLHVADRIRDIVNPNADSCPRLIEIGEELAKTNQEYHKFNTSHEANTLRKFQREVLKVPNPSEDMTAIDCLMTTICTDRILPDPINDYDGGNSSSNNNDSSDDDDDEYGTNMFQRLYDFDVQQYTYKVKSNNAEFARLGIGPLWKEILAQIEPHLKIDDDDDDDSDRRDSKKPKLSIFSGHDTTIIPLLASIDPNLWGDKDWPPYASMVLIELYKQQRELLTGDDGRKETTTKFVFRLIYNGNVLTNTIKGCDNDDDNELCDIQILLDRVKPFATYDLDVCQRKTPITGGGGGGGLSLPGGIQLDPVSKTKDILSTPDGTAYLVLIVLASAFVGGILVCVCSCCCLYGDLDCWKCRQRRTSRPVENDDNGDDKFYDEDPML